MSEIGRTSHAYSETSETSTVTMISSNIANDGVCERPEGEK